MKGFALPVPRWSLLLALALVPAAPAAAQDGGNGARAVYSADQSRRGEEAFQVNCSHCHATSQFTGATFLKTWGKGTVAELYDFLSTSMPQDMPGALEPQEYVDIVAYFLRRNGLPAGSAELPADPAVLRTIRLSAPNGGAQLPLHPPQRLPPPPAR